jgi:hypothetical protein
LSVLIALASVPPLIVSEVRPSRVPSPSASLRYQTPSLIVDFWRAALSWASTALIRALSSGDRRSDGCRGQERRAGLRGARHTHRRVADREIEHVLAEVRTDDGRDA